VARPEVGTPAAQGTQLVTLEADAGAPATDDMPPFGFTPEVEELEETPETQVVTLTTPEAVAPEAGRLEETPELTVPDPTLHGSGAVATFPVLELLVAVLQEGTLCALG